MSCYSKRKLMAWMRREPTDFAEFTVVGNNTVRYCLASSPEVVHYRLYDTDVVTLFSGGAFILNTGGWSTVTTLNRMRRYCPSRFSIKK